MHPSGPFSRSSSTAGPMRGLDRLLPALSAFTMVMTVPQVIAVWERRGASGVSLASWIAYLLSALVWLIHGIRRRDRAIWLACIGWILLDAAVVVGVLVHR